MAGAAAGLVLLVSVTSARALEVATGSYVGTGLDNRVVAGVAFAPEVVLVASESPSQREAVYYRGAVEWIRGRVGKRVLGRQRPDLRR